MDPIYLDHHASTPVDPRVFEAMRKWFEEDFGNPHASEHAFGWRAHEAIETSRARVAALIGSDPDEIVFTSGATEANNLAIFGAARALHPTRSEVLISAIDHAAVLEPAAALADLGFRVRTIPVLPNGHVDLNLYRDMLSERVALVSVIAVNNEIGVVQRLDALASLAQDVGALFHTDAAQALVGTEFDVTSTGVDLASLASHKAYGPKGVGALYVRAGIPALVPILFGGGQERGLRPGTLPVPLCVGFGVACAILSDEGKAERARVGALKQRLLRGLMAASSDLELNGDSQSRHPGNLNVRIRGVHGASLVESLQPHLACSTGSACRSGSVEPSHVLRAIGLDADAARTSIRLGIGRFNTPEQVDEAVRLLGTAIERLRAIEGGRETPPARGLSAG